MSIRPLFSQELHFFKEKITIEILDEYCVLLGEYFFENLSNTSLTRVFYYPVVVNKSLHFPHFFRVKNNHLNQEIPFTVSKKGISFTIKISPHDITSCKVEYHQKTTQRVFEYILKSTHSWKVPIDSVEIVIEVPKKFKLQSISIPYDRVINQEDKLQYLITRDSFYPDKNLLIKWESK